MSVINRMLSDLEGRGERSLDGGVQAPAPGHEPRPKNRIRAYGPPTVLALALVVVALALVYQRAPALLAIGSSEEGGQSTQASPAAGGQAQTSAVEQSATPSRPALERLVFESEADATSLHIATSARPGGPPAYERDGSEATLRIPVAGADNVAIPAPPASQDVVRSLRLDAATDPPALRLQLAPDARIDVTTSAGGYVVTARAPKKADSSTQGAAAGGAAQAEQVAAAADTAAADSSMSEGEASAASPTDGDETGGPTTSAQGAAGSSTAGAGKQTATDEAQSAQTPSAHADDAARQNTAEPTGQSEDSDTKAADGSNRQGTASGGVEAAQIRQSGDSGPNVRAKRRYRAARQALSDGELAGARSELRAALAADPDLHAARDLLVTLLRRSGESEAAREVLAEGIERAPKRRAYAQPYARLLAQAGELARAAEVLSRAAPKGVGEPGYHALRGAIAQRLDRHEQAITAYTRALEGEANNGRWWLGLAISLAAADYPSQARSAFREARASGDLSERLDRWARDRMEALTSSGRE